MAIQDLEWGVAQYKQQSLMRKYTLYWNYYDGNQRLAFATEKFRSTFGHLFKEFAENVCPPVIDSLVDRLKLVGFRSSAAQTSTTEVPSIVQGVPARKRVQIADPYAQVAWETWERNRMDLRSKDTHREAAMMGDGYVIVWPDENMQAAIFSQLANEVFVEYDPNTPNKVLRASKRWFNKVDRYWYLNVYVEEGIYKYKSRETVTQAPETTGGYAPYDEVPNPYGQVPVFHFSRGTMQRPGISDLKDVIPVQDALNKSVMDMLIAMEFASYKQRYIIGMDVETDPDTGEPTDAVARNYGADRMMTIPNEDAKVGQFDATDLGQFLRVQEKFWASTARVSGTPLHYFFITQGDFPSGEAQKAAEARFSSRIEDCHTGFGNVWEDVITFAMKIDGTHEEGTTLSSMWSDASPRSDAELADTGVKKKAIGVPRTQLLREMGYSDDEIEMFIEESDAESVQSFMLQQKSQENTNPSGSQERSTTQPTGQNTRGVRQ